MPAQQCRVRASSDPGKDLVPVQTYIDHCGSVAELVASAPPLTPEAAEELRRLLPDLGQRTDDRRQTVRGAA